MKVPAYLFLAGVIILFICLFFMAVTTDIEVHTLGNRVEDALIASGWAGFSKLDFNELARRKEITSEQSRNITLDKIAARTVVEEYIRENLKLSGSNYPLSDSFIDEKSKPVNIQEITVFNPTDLPAVCSKGTEIRITTIHIVVQIPARIPYLDVIVYFEKHVDVDVATFYKN